MGFRILFEHYGRADTDLAFSWKKSGTRTSVRLGSVISVIGIVCLILPVATEVLCPVGLCLIGLGFAPMYPCTMQDTPLRFGREFSQIAIGYQHWVMANIGYTLLPILVGAVAGVTTLWIIPCRAFILLLCFVIFMKNSDACITKPAADVS